MSQSATLYRVSQDIFRQLEKSGSNRRLDINSAKNFAIFQGTFMGLEFILSKGRHSSIVELLSEIFNPKQALGEQEFENLPPEEQFEYYESGSLMPYLEVAIISKLDDFLEKVSETDIHLNYDSKELNDNGIYPRVWSDDNSPNVAYSKQVLLEDLTGLKKIVKEAKEERDYIFVFLG